MDLSTWLSIIGIILTCIGLFVTVNKTKVTNKNSHNSNLRNSLNKIKVVDKSKKIYEHQEHHEHHHQHIINNPQTIQTTSGSQSDEIGIMILYGVVATALFGSLIFFFIEYKETIMRIFTGIMTVGLLIAILVANYKRYISVSYKYYILFYWLVVFWLSLLINHPIYKPENLDSAIGEFTNIDVMDAPKTLWGLYQNGNQTEASFLTFQIAGIGLMIFYLLSYFTLIFKLIANKTLLPIVSIIKMDIVFVILTFLFTSGVFTNLIKLLQSTTQ